MLSSSSTSPLSYFPFVLSSSPISFNSAPSSTRFSPSIPASATSSSCSYTCTEDQKLRASGRCSSRNESLYEVLNVPVTATFEEIKSAYRRLARIYHPDVAGTDRVGSSTEEFMKIHEAYSTLADPEKRAVYNRKNVWRRIMPLTAGTVSAYGGYVGRNWETDQCW